MGSVACGVEGENGPVCRPADILTAAVVVVVDSRGVMGAVGFMGPATAGLSATGAGAAPFDHHQFFFPLYMNL